MKQTSLMMKGNIKNTNTKDNRSYQIMDPIAYYKIFSDF